MQLSENHPLSVLHTKLSQHCSGAGTRVNPGIYPLKGLRQAQRRKRKALPKMNSIVSFVLKGLDKHGP